MANIGAKVVKLLLPPVPEHPDTPTNFGGHQSLHPSAVASLRWVE
jgi:hypothetical protein